MNTNLVIKSENGNPVTTSLLVAEKFGKEHRNIIRDIDVLKKDVLTFEQMFKESFYLDSYSRKQRMYILNRDGFTLLAMGFNGKEALSFKVEYIQQFNKMEKLLSKGQFSITNFSKTDLARMIIESEEEKERIQLQLDNKTQQLDESKEWFSIKRYARLHKLAWRDIKWRALKAISYEHGYEIKKVFDANYGEVNIYHVDVFSIYTQSN